MIPVPCLPATAPFSPAERAWLDGFIAGLFGEAEQSPATAPVDDELLWHDPTLALDERLELAAGRRPEHQLMAAMAQLDCGQCGYLCESYAAAIAGGTEASLSRCVPGGKATSRALKELLAEIASPDAPKALAVVASAPPLAPQPGDATPRFAVRLRKATSLHRAGAEKDTRHVVLETVDEDIAYKPGDSLAIVARNCPDLVAAIIERLGATFDTPVRSADDIERPLVTALSASCEIRRPSDQAIEVLASRASNRDESRVLQAIAEGYPGAGPQNADLLDLLDAYPSARPPLSELIAALDPLQPRLYSIASSPKKVAGEIHLAVAVVRYRLRERERGGVASTFLSDRLAPGGTLSAYVNSGDGFRLPAPDRPVIMIGPGTGVAPFRAFLEERQATGARGRNWLFFGNPRRASDFLFEGELAAYCRDGLLDRLDTAFSRDQPHKIYVQHRMLEHAAELWAWLEDGAYLYVCGDAERMARDVDRSLAYIIAKEGGMDMPGPRPISPASPEKAVTPATSIDRGRRGAAAYGAIRNDATATMTRPLHGRRIALLETREADRLAAMLREEGAEIVACPAVAIVLPADPGPALAWLGRFTAAPFDDLILLTGEGLYRLRDLAQPAGVEPAFLTALSRTRTICRGPKPVRALRMLRQQPQLRAEEPTTEGVLALLSSLDLRGRRVGVQLYPGSGDRLVAFLEGAGAIPDPVTPYEYASHVADESILALIDQLAAGAIDVVALTSAPQVRRLFDVAQSHGCADRLLTGLNRTTIAAIGPVVAEAVRRHGLAPAIMPSGSYFMKPLVSAIAATMN